MIFFRDLLLWTSGGFLAWLAWGLVRKAPRFDVSTTPAPPTRPCRLWRLLPEGRQAVHLYVARLDDLEGQGERAHLGKRIYVRTLDRVYQWTEGRREEVDGARCVFPIEPE